MNQIFTEKFNSQFDGIKGLTWYPWVGIDYTSSGRRILIVGESHYIKEDSDERAIEREKEIKENKTQTIQCLHEVLIDKSWSNRTYPNLMKALCDEAIVKDNEECLRKIAYYNFIQRQLSYMTDPHECPNSDDYRIAWECFIEVIKILKPTDCIFVGVRNYTDFESSMKTLGIEHTLANYLEKINGASPRIAQLKLDDKYELKLLFIKHASSFFSPQIWHDFLKENAREAMDCINSK